MPTLATVCAEALASPGVVAVVCVDAQGLCLHSEGSVPGAASSISELAMHAQLLSNDPEALVQISSAQGRVVLRKAESGIVTALFMQPGE